jgi:16S rRNA (guanine(966)-N(2))-methyltransferase RsmD
MESKLQIISGRYRGRKLFLPRDARPTQNMARIALFNILLPIVPHTRPFIVWDAFAGSGAFGVEFLSRFNNATAVFTDNSAESFKTLNKNLVGIAGGRVEMTDALSAVHRIGADADIVFLDPPYAEHDIGVAFVRKLGAVAHTGALLVWESEVGRNTTYSADVWECLRDKTYGRARFLILQKK